MCTIHVVRILRAKSPGIQFVYASDLNLSFPELSSAVRFARDRAGRSDCAIRVVVEEKRTGKRKVEYQADGSGSIRRVPLV